MTHAARPLIILPFIAMLLVAGAADAAPAQRDSTTRVGSKRWKKEATATLDRSRAEFRRLKTDDPNRLMARSTESAFEALLILARCWDRDTIYAEEIRTQEEDFRSGLAAARLDDAAHIKNAMLGIYGLNALLYQIRFHTDTTKINDIIKQHRFTIEAINQEKSLIPTLRILANSIFNYLFVTVYSLDTTTNFRNDLANYEFQYGQGERVARDEQDRLMNAMYRIFELNRLWGLTLSKKTVSDFSTLSKDQKARIDKIDNVGMQVATSFEFYYRVLDVLTRKYLLYKM